MAVNLKKTILVLGGNSSANAFWVEQIADSFKLHCKVIVIRYGHWKNESGIDFSAELSRLALLPHTASNTTVIAKSAGILLALQAIERGTLTPETLIALGIPLKFASQRGLNVKELVASMPSAVRILSIQQENDPEGAADILHEVLPPTIEKLVISGNDHQYNDWPQIIPLITAALRS